MTKIQNSNKQFKKPFSHFEHLREPNIGYAKDIHEHFDQCEYLS